MYKLIFTYEINENVTIEIFENEVLKLFRGRITEINSEKKFILDDQNNNDELNLLFLTIEKYHELERKRSEET